MIQNGATTWGSAKRGGLAQNLDFAQRSFKELNIILLLSGSREFAYVSLIKFQFEAQSRKIPTCDLHKQRRMLVSHFNQNTALLLHL